MIICLTYYYAWLNHRPTRPDEHGWAAKGPSRTWHTSCMYVMNTGHYSYYMLLLTYCVKWFFQAQNSTVFVLPDTYNCLFVAVSLLRAFLFYMRRACHTSRHWYSEAQCSITRVHKYNVYILKTIDTCEPWTFDWMVAKSVHLSDSVSNYNVL